MPNVKTLKRAMGASTSPVALLVKSGRSDQNSQAVQKFNRVVDLSSAKGRRDGPLWTSIKCRCTTGPA